MSCIYFIMTLLAMFMGGHTPHPDQAGAATPVSHLKLPPRHPGANGCGAVGLDICSHRHHLCLSWWLCPPADDCLHIKVTELVKAKLRLRCFQRYQEHRVEVCDVHEVYCGDPAGETDWSWSVISTTCHSGTNINCKNCFFLSDIVALFTNLPPHHYHLNL